MLVHIEDGIKRVEVWIMYRRNRAMKPARRVPKPPSPRSGRIDAVCGSAPPEAELLWFAVPALAASEPELEPLLAEPEPWLISLLEVALLRGVVELAP